MEEVERPFYRGHKQDEQKLAQRQYLRAQGIMGYLQKKRGKIEVTKKQDLVHQAENYRLLGPGYTHPNR